MNVLHTESLGVFSRRLEELRSQESAAAVSVFLEKFALRFSVYLQGVQNLKDKALRSKLGDDLLAYANETGSPALDKLESALEDHPDANLQGLHFLRISLKDTAKPKDTMKRLQQLQKEIWDFVGDVDGKVQDDAAIIVKKKQLIEEQNSKCQQATDLSLQVLLTLLAVYAQSRPGALKASG